MTQSEIVSLTLNRLQNFEFGETDFSRPALLVKNESGVVANDGRYAIVTSDTKLDQYSTQVKAKIQNAFLQSYNGYGIADLLIINWKDEENLEDCLQAMEIANPKQYWALSSSIVDAEFDITEDLKPLIQFCMNNDRFYFMAYSQIEPLMESVKAWQDLSYKRVFALYSSEENCNQGIDLSLASLLVANTPGNLTAKFKSLANFTPDDALSTDDKNLLKTASINMYIREGSKNSRAFLITEGVTIDADYFDFIFGLDYMQVQVVNEIRNLFLQQKNIDLGFNARGYALIKSAILTGLKPFVKNEFIDDHTEILITEPSEITSENFQKRILHEIAIDIQLIQKIHFLDISLNAGVSTVSTSGEDSSASQTKQRTLSFSSSPAPAPEKKTVAKKSHKRGQ